MRAAPREHVANRTTWYLDQVIGRLKLPSDYALAQLLELSPTAIYKMRGGGGMAIVTAAKVAELLELEPLKVIAETEPQRSTAATDLELWRRLAKRAAAVVVAAIGVSVAPPPASAAPSSTAAVPSVCIMSTRRRRTAGFALQAFLARLAGVAL